MILKIFTLGNISFKKLSHAVFQRVVKNSVHLYFWMTYLIPNHVPDLLAVSLISYTVYTTFSLFLIVSNYTTYPDFCFLYPRLY